MFNRFRSRRGTLLAAFSAATAVGSRAMVAAADVVERRGTEPTIIGDIVSMDDSGVTITSQFGARHVVPWDRVRSVEDDRPSSDLKARLARAEDLWRARSRVERHDTSLAEPLLHGLFFEDYKGRTCETSLVVAEGLLRCLLARQEHALAVVPALEVARLRRSGIETDSYSRLEPVYDSATALCPSLAPAWLPGRSLDRLQRELANYSAEDDQVVAALASLYLAAARQAGGQPADVPAIESMPPHPGVSILHAMVECSPSGEAAAVDAARRLADRLSDMPDWAQAWGRYRVGMSLLAASDRATQNGGLVQLMHVPSTFGRSQPYLAGLALESAATALAARGDADAAASVRNELARAFPDHPVRIDIATP